MEIMKKIVAKEKDLLRHRPVTIAFLGDSVTQGCFELTFDSTDGNYDIVYDYEQVYHSKLKKLLHMFYPETPIQIINAGVSGSTTAGALKRLQSDVLSFSPDLTVVCLGLNDFVKGMDGIADFESSLSNIFCQLIQNHSEVIFMTPNSCPRHITKKLDPYCDSWVQNIEENVQSGTMDRYMETAKEVCKKYHVPVCDCYSKWITLEKTGIDPTKLLSNSLNHPTREMHWLFAVSLFETMLNS